jgi:UrcA family protein
MKIAILTLVALSSLGGVADAQPIVIDASGSHTSHVQVADLNLAATEGRATAARRIRGAAAELCANDGDRSIASQLESHNCYRGAVDDGLRQIQTAKASLSSTANRGF